MPLPFGMRGDAVLMQRRCFEDPRIDRDRGPRAPHVQICHDLARDHVGERAWNIMNTHERATSVYAEPRKFDLALIADRRLMNGGPAPGREQVSPDTA